MSNRGNFGGITQVLGWRDYTPELLAVATSGTPTQPIFVNATRVGRYLVTASGKVHYNGQITWGSSDTLPSGDSVWGVRLPVPALGGVDVPIGTAFAWQNSISNLNLVITPTLMDPLFPSQQSDQAYYAQFFLSEMLSSGTSSITSGNTSVAITHNLGSTPVAYDITVTPTATTTNNPGPIYIDTITSTQFTVNCKANPGASNLPFAWKARAWPNGSQFDLLVNHQRPWPWASGHTLGWALTYETRH